MHCMIPLFNNGINYERIERGTLMTKRVYRSNAFVPCHAFSMQSGGLHSYHSLSTKKSVSPYSFHWSMNFRPAITTLELNAYHTNVDSALSIGHSTTNRTQHLSDFSA